MKFITFRTQTPTDDRQRPAARDDARILPIGKIEQKTASARISLLVTCARRDAIWRGTESARSLAELFTRRYGRGVEHSRGAFKIAF